MMKRRGFLKMIGASALVPVVGKAALNERTLEAVCEDLRNDGVSLQSIAHPYIGNECAEDMVCGFGLAPVKAEGAQADYDVCDCDDGPHGTACSNRNVLRRM
jgi:hypothetical protein